MNRDPWDERNFHFSNHDDDPWTEFYEPPPSHFVTWMWALGITLVLIVWLGEWL